MNILQLSLCFAWTFSVLILADAKRVKMDRLSGVCRGKNAPIYVNYTNINSKDEKMFHMNVNMYIKEDIEGDLKLNVVIIRCRSIENLDTCEEYLKYENLNYCVLIDPRNVVSPWYIKFEPQFKCPIKKGSYHSINSTIDMSGIIVFPLDGWFWKSKTEIKQGDRIIQCFDIELHTIRG